MTFDLRRSVKATVVRFAALICLLVPLAGSAAAATVSTVVENVAVEVPGGTLTIKRIELSGKGSSGADVVALFERAEPNVLIERLRNLDAPSLVMPEVVAEYGLGDVKVRKVYRDVRLADVVHGRIGAASIGKIDILLTQAPRTPVRGGIGGVIARNVDLVLLARVLIGPRTTSGETAGSLADYLTMRSIDIDVPRELRVDVERISAARLSVRRLGGPLLSLPARFEAIDRDPRPRDERQTAVLRLLSDLAASFTLGSFEVRGVRVTVPRGPTSFRLERFALADLALPRLGEAVLEGLSFNSADVLNGVGLVSLRGVDARMPLARLGALMGRGADAFVADAALAGTVFDRLLVQRFSVRPLVRGTVDRVVAGDDYILLDRFELNAADPLNGVPGALYGRADGFRVNTKLSARQDPLGSLAELGYKYFDVSTARFDLAWNAATREIVLDGLSVEMPGIGSLELGASVSGASPDLFAAEPAIQVAAALGLRFQKLQAVVRNAGVMEKATAAVAADKHAPVEAMRTKMAQDASVEIAERLGGGRAGRVIADAVARFIEQPQSLRIGASSPEGLGLADVPKVAGPGDLLDRLDVTASAD